MPLTHTALPSPAHQTILTAEALAFLTKLHNSFNARRLDLLAQRTAAQQAINQGQLPDFLKETADIRQGDWKIAGIPEDLLDRRVEITGPVSRKMVINALNSGAQCFMADFEDATSPTWAELLDGQVNMMDAVRRTISYDDPNNGKHYKLNDRIATLIVRPRGWHLDEAHVQVDGQNMSGSLFDFGLYLFHNHQALKDHNTGPYFYLPKLETWQEAKLWNDVCAFAEQELGISHGTIKATVLIETITAAFQMDEILHALKDYIVALNCGRWDYIFSYIKKLQAHKNYVLPDRAQVTMSVPFMANYSLLLIQTCHKRGAFAMGGMAAQIPIKGDDAANDEAIGKVRADKEREAGNGHDGTWVAHPALVPVAKEVFDRLMPGKNQLDNPGTDKQFSQSDLLDPCDGSITEEGLRGNIRVGIGYCTAWLNGQGCVPLYNLMEDAATAEICRTQVWQWLKHGAQLDDGRTVDTALFEALFAEEVAALSQQPQPGTFQDACRLFKSLCLEDTLNEFLTLPAYAHIITTNNKNAA